MCELVALAGMALSSCAMVKAATTRSGGTMMDWALLWVLYLSLYLVGQKFLSFQWDILLLEVGFTTIWLLPAMRSSSHAPPPLPMVWVVRWILFKLMLMSGVVKLQAQCPTWLHLTALKYHFATQCIPTPLAWFMHHLPPVLQQWGVAVTMWIEGPACWLLLSPLRKPRIFGASLQIALQVLIILTGNYNFFNALTILLACIHFDDTFLTGRLSPHPAAAEGHAHEDKPAGVDARRLAEQESQAASQRERARRRVAALEDAASYVVVAASLATLTWMVGLDSRGGMSPVLLVSAQDLDSWLGTVLPWTILYFWCVLLPLVSLQHLWGELSRSKSVGAAIGRLMSGLVAVMAAVLIFAVSARPMEQLHPSVTSALPPVPPQAYSLAQTYHVAGGYGLFRRMTGVGRNGEVARPEVIIEGTTDGERWLEYEFRYKPGDTRRRPPLVAPHQPRLDWQMWFAALGTYHHNPWFVHLCVKILQGSGDVLDLLDTDRLPFPRDQPPKALRASLYEYDFSPSSNSTDPSVWWTRRFKAEYLPGIDLDNESVKKFIKQHRWNNAAPSKGLPRKGFSQQLDNFIHTMRWPGGLVWAFTVGCFGALAQEIVEHLCSKWLLEGLSEELKPKAE
eukprot:CAMPEP_0114281828 /NCGR_PEP_ID=MMETSP0059-20121206/3223_1 /TAXON_ID=36894 /ORGANISM="Pyramimonas parkeae, Strain CCMP726" /LENGTH=621 /DNA_ID=CAMNT_0001402409 /DNA_START=201 /DNA_END=2066 /DNA_ORIENTATION=+